MINKFNIAIDGPAGSGKTTIGKLLARKLNYQFLDSGLLYRHFSLFYKNFLDKEEIFAKSISNFSRIEEVIEKWQGNFICRREKFVNDLEKERDLLNSSEISTLTPQLSPNPKLRKIIFNFQRELTSPKGWIVIGRDIGSEVLPKAEIKIFLTASLEERTKRRSEQTQLKVSQEEIEKSLKERDEKDKNRVISPLKKTTDSWEIDVTNLTIQETIKRILNMVKKINMLKKDSETEKKSSAVHHELEKIIENITKDFGEGSATLLGENNFLQKQEVLSTGSFLLDQAIGTGGYVPGKIIEIFGLQSSGKSTLSLHAVKECQKLGKKAVYFDLENSLNVKYSKDIGVKTEELIVPYPSSGEEVFNMIVGDDSSKKERRKGLIESGVDLIIIDSVSNLIPRAQLEASLEKQRVGSHAALMSAGLRKLKSALTNKKTIVIFINQVRKNISTGFFAGSPEVTTGGMALDFDSDLRIKLKVKEKLVKDEKTIGIKVEAKIVKNKLATPDGIANLEIIYSCGIQKKREVLDLAIEKNIIQKSGNWYSYGEKKLGNGKENVTDYLTENPDFYQEIEKKVIEKSGIKNPD